MVQLSIALVSGVIFGLGLAISHMVDPAKVLGFLDVAGDWDPSLAFVMGGAVIVYAAAVQWAKRQAQPRFAPAFAPQPRGGIDARLVGGSLLFGVGWGLVGLCPGPAVTTLAFGRWEGAMFLAAMLLGAALTNLLPGAVTRGVASAT